MNIMQLNTIKPMHYTSTHVFDKNTSMNKDLAIMYKATEVLIDNRFAFVTSKTVKIKQLCSLRNHYVYDANIIE